MSAEKRILFEDLSQLFSKPIANEGDTLDYIPTQYIPEYAKNIGYDGIAYSSSLTPEIYEKHPKRYNVVIFDKKSMNL